MVATSFAHHGADAINVPGVNLHGLYDTLKQMYKRVLLKLSGEQLAGKYDSGVDTELMARLADQIKPVVGAGTEVVIMVGGGNYARGNWRGTGLAG